jgi:type IV pilus assembly protein PilY1
MRTRIILSCSAALMLNALPSMAQAGTTLDLADQPLFSATQVAGNLALTLSVEFPTAVSVAHLDATYNSASTYLGYFDPNKCYAFKFVDVEGSSNMSHFAPSATATAHQCTGTAAHLWSGNYMNWATTQTIDPFRWAMTGGYRVVDTPSLTLLEKAWASGQGGTGNFPDRVVTTAADIAAATPFLGTGSLTAYVQDRGQQVNFVADGAVGTGGFLATYFNGINLDYDATPANPVLTRTERINFDWGTGSPKAGTVNSDNFSVRWVALQTAPSTGQYAFQTYSDDGVRLWVNGQLLIDHWNVHGGAYDVGTISLSAGQPMNIRVEYFESTGSAIMKLNWKRPGDNSYSVYTAGDYWYAPIRVKVCDPGAPGGLESNCIQHANGNYKPEGLMQQYANKIRFSVFAYLNDSNVLRDGGVLRARQKFIGPTYPVPGSPATSNSAAEWDDGTGVFALNPDSGDASATNTLLGTSIANSGAINYVNKFGEITPGSYKSYDPVGELYYAALRYYKNQGNVAAWSNMSGADAATKKTWADGFPVITSWNDPIQYSCQKNFILGIGDVNTHADKNVPGLTSTATEPTKPGPADGLMSDSSYSAAYNAVTATNKVGELQGMGANLGAAMNVGGCCSNNADLMAGLAYDANTRDIRADLTGMQTVQTYWIDVLEYQTYKANNQFYLAAKYGGFKVPDGFAPYTRTTALDDNWWHTSTDTVGAGSSAQPRPDNYFTGGRPDLMVAGLNAAFANIADSLSAAKSAVFVTSSPDQSVSGASYGSGYNPKSWTGSVTGSLVNYDTADGTPTLTPKWDAGPLLDTTAPTARKVVTCCKLNGTALPFNSDALSTNALSGRTYYGSFSSVPGVAVSSQSATDFVNYLRGDRTRERGHANGVYRKRDQVMGDIVDSKILPVGPPDANYYDNANPGYSAFKKGYRNRKTVVYAGANDGMLHAIDGQVPTGTGASTGGGELFAYVPSFLYGNTGTAGSSGLAALGNPSYVHSFRVNGQLRATDVNFNQTYGVTGGGTALAEGDWHTVLVGGLGKGGKGYFAIDITDPGSWTGATAAAAEAAVARKVLWEFPAAPELANIPNHALASSARASATMGYSYGEPQIVKTARFGWVALFTSGYNNADGKGYLYVVDIRTGALLDTVVTPEGSLSAPINLTRVTGFIPSPSTFLVEAVYGADMRGNVWRFDLSGAGAYAAPTKIAVLSNASGTAQSVSAPLRVAIDPGTSNKRFILIGTGRLLADSDIGSTDTQSFYALVDGDVNQFFSAASLPAGISFPLTRDVLKPVTNLDTGASNVTMGWYLDLKLPTDPTGGIAYRVTLAPIYFNGYVAFAANQPSGDPCAPSGKGRLFELAMGNGQRWSLQPSDSMYVDLTATSSKGQVLVIGTNGTGTISSGTRHSAAVRSGSLNWREAPSDE